MRKVLIMIPIFFILSCNTSVRNTDYINCVYTLGWSQGYKRALENISDWKNQRTIDSLEFVNFYKK